MARTSIDVVRMGLSQLPPDDLAAWVERSCASQGVPVKVTDAGVQRVVSVLMNPLPGGEPAASRSGSRRGPGPESQTPHRLHPVGVQRSGPGLPGCDHGVVEHGLDNGSLSAQVELPPISA